EKDLSGQYAMQALMQGMPAQPEPSDEEIKDAVWIVVATPSQQRGPMGGGGDAPISPKLKQHLDAGGSALALTFPQADNLAAATKEWGIEATVDAIAVHARVEQAGAQSSDYLEEARRLPYV